MPKVIIIQAGKIILKFLLLAGVIKVRAETKGASKNQNIINKDPLLFSFIK